MGRSDINSRGGGSRGGRGGSGKGRGGKPYHHKGKATASQHPPQRHKKVVVTFNSTDRHDYLTGFSSRKKERRAFGLAMQKVKDRQSKLDERKESREAQLEKIEDIERNKAALRKGLAGKNNEDDDDDGDNSASDNDDDNAHNNKNEAHHNEQEMKTFQDEQTTHQFGGLVSVTTTFGIPSDDDDDDDNNLSSEFYARKEHGSNHIDEAQKSAGDVNNYMKEVKGTMGSKKKSGGGNKHKKGMHGASSMKGMGNGTTLKAAKKTLAKFKKGEDERGGRGGKGGKRAGAKERRKRGKGKR